MSNPPEPSKALQEKVHALSEEAYAAYAARGIPPQEVTGEALVEYMDKQFSEAEIAEILGCSREQLMNEAVLAVLLNLAEDMRASGEEVPIPAEIDRDLDPGHVERVQKFQRAFREHQGRTDLWANLSEQLGNE